VIPKWLIIGFIIISFLGFLDATYLTAKHYLGGTIPCSLYDGCNEVAASKYSVIFGIPVALYGVMYYLTALMLSLIYLDLKSARILTVIPPITLFGVIASAWLVYLQLFVIDAVCIYCMGSAATSTILFIFGLLLFKYMRAVDTSTIKMI